MHAPWQPLLDWWFGHAESASEVAAEKGKLWFGKRNSQDLEAQTRFGVFVDQALAGELTERTQCPEGWLAVVLLLDQLQCAGLRIGHALDASHHEERT